MISRELLNELYVNEGLAVRAIAQKLKCSEHKVNIWSTHYLFQ